MERTKAQETARARRRAGFTLLELMVSLAVGGVALGSVYAIGAASTRHFREQQRIAHTQSSLRFALDQLKKDFQRAGYLGTPNVNLPSQACIVPAAFDTAGFRLAALSSFVEDNTEAATNLDFDQVAGVDEIVLFGNYSTSGEYGGISSANPTSVSVPSAWQSFRRDFTVWSESQVTPPHDEEVSKNVFVPGRLVRLHTRTGPSHFARVQSIVTSTGGDWPLQITLNDLDGIPSGCDVNNGWVSPLNAIRYHVENDPTPTRDPTNRSAQLRRTEVVPTDDKSEPLADEGTDEAIDDRAILDYVIGFDLQFVGHPPNMPNVLELFADGGGGGVGHPVNNRPEAVRAVIITLSVRTPVQDPTMPFLAAVSDAPLRSYRVNELQQGAARVRTMRAEIFLQNIAIEGRL